jgi:hypothetical protein
VELRLDVLVERRMVGVGCEIWRWTDGDAGVVRVEGELVAMTKAGLGGAGGSC